MDFIKEMQQLQEEFKLEVEIISKKTEELVKG